MTSRDTLILFNLMACTETTHLHNMKGDIHKYRLCLTHCRSRYPSLIWRKNIFDLLSQTGKHILHLGMTLLSVGNLPCANVQDGYPLANITLLPRTTSASLSGGHQNPIYQQLRWWAEQWYMQTTAPICKATPAALLIHRLGWTAQEVGNVRCMYIYQLASWRAVYTAKLVLSTRRINPERKSLSYGYYVSRTTTTVSTSIFFSASNRAANSQAVFRLVHTEEYQWAVHAARRM